MKINHPIHGPIHTLFGAALFLLVALSGCVTDEIYRTDHPDRAKVTVTADWSDRGEGIAAPESFTVGSGGVAEEAENNPYTLATLFEPGDREFLLYNPAAGIAVRDGVAQVAAAEERTADGSARIEPLPGWFFTGTVRSRLEKDEHHRLVASMRQQVRQLTLLLTPQGDGSLRIASIEGELTGVAGQYDPLTDAHSAPSVVPVGFSEITDGKDAGRWSATVRLLGIAAEQQRLECTVRLPDGRSFDLQSDLSDGLSEFNADKKNPLSLEATVEIRYDTETGFTATIQGWKPVAGGSGTAK